jgi:hypothetical protein
MKALKYLYKDELVTINYLHKLTGIKHDTLHTRINRQGMSVEDAVNKKLQGSLGLTIQKGERLYVSGKEENHGMLHIKIAEKALGKKLPKGAVVHHVDGNKLNNVNSNLCIFPSNSYHIFIHARMKALEECGNANYRKCKFCKKYDDQNNLILDKCRWSFHRICKNNYQRERYQRLNPISETRTGKSNTRTPLTQARNSLSIATTWAKRLNRPYSPVTWSQKQ